MSNRDSLLQSEEVESGGAIPNSAHLEFSTTLTRPQILPTVLFSEPTAHGRELRTLDHLLPLLAHYPPERLCFICLDNSDDSSDPDSKLVSCCTRCYAVTHPGCWRDWRSSQASYARRTRVSGNRLAADPFLCSICKSGAARIQGEHVTIRWLEAFASFGRRSAHQVRVASGLFSALTGARGEDIRRPTTTDSDSDSSYDEEDFIDFIETEAELGSRGALSVFFCGNSKKFFLANSVFIILFLVLNVVISEADWIEETYQILGATLTLCMYGVLVTAYIMLKYQRILNQRYIGGT